MCTNGVQLIFVGQYLDGTTDVTRTWVGYESFIVVEGILLTRIHYSISEHPLLVRFVHLPGYSKGI